MLPTSVVATLCRTSAARCGRPLAAAAIAAGRNPVACPRRTAAPLSTARGKPPGKSAEAATAGGDDNDSDNRSSSDSSAPSSTSHILLAEPKLDDPHWPVVQAMGNLAVVKARDDLGRNYAALVTAAAQAVVAQLEAMWVEQGAVSYGEVPPLLIPEAGVNFSVDALYQCRLLAPHDTVRGLEFILHNSPAELRPEAIERMELLKLSQVIEHEQNRLLKSRSALRAVPTQAETAAAAAAAASLDAFAGVVRRLEAFRRDHVDKRKTNKMLKHRGIRVNRDELQAVDARAIIADLHEAWMGLGAEHCGPQRHLARLPYSTTVRAVELLKTIAPEECADLLELCVLPRITPSMRTTDMYNLYLSALCLASRPDAAQEVLRGEMENECLPPPNNKTYTQMVRDLAKWGHPTEALACFKTMVDSSTADVVASWRDWELALVAVGRGGVLGPAASEKAAAEAEGRSLTDLERHRLQIESGWAVIGLMKDLGLTPGMRQLTELSRCGHKPKGCAPFFFSDPETNAQHRALWRDHMVSFSL